MKRIRKELNDLRKEDLGQMTLAPQGDDDLFHWVGTIPGPDGSPYEGGVFSVEVQLPGDYPFSAPKVNFATRIYHMNISERGNICIDILKTNWSPALSLFKVMLSLSSLLTDPNPKDPLVPSIAMQYQKSRKKHDETAREWTRLYAKTPATAPKAVAAPKPAATVTRIIELPQPSSSSRPPPSATTRRQPITSDAIEISSSDDETPSRGSSRLGLPATSSSSARRKRTAQGAAVVAEGRQKRRRGGPTQEIIYID